MIVGAPAVRDIGGEALLAATWERGWLDGRPLVDSVGRQLRVVYPGRRWGGPGPDFQGAVLELADSTLLRGDVEVHQRAADWRAHGHHRDPAYNRTVLHVVLWAGGADRDVRQDGVALPVVELGGHLAAPLAQLAARLRHEASPQATACLESVDDLTRIVDQAALERFFQKAAVFESDLTHFTADEVLYRAVLVALGYSANKQACAQLGELVPWSLARRVGRAPDGEARLRALLLGAAGLLPSQRGLAPWGDEPRRLEALWPELAPELDRRPLGPVWRLVGVRPENSPVRRLVGGAALFAAWAAGAGPAALLERISACKPRPAALAELFRARSAERFWAERVDFDVPGAAFRPWQVGRPRASEIVVNALLPLGYAVGRSQDRPDLAADALLAYRAMPTGPWNRISRAMAVQLFGAQGMRHCRGAARQQGLLHLFSRWCWERRCDACPAGANRCSTVFKPPRRE